MKIIFLGTPQFGAVCLKKLVTSGYPPSLVITNPDRPAGRGLKITSSPVSQVANSYNLSTIKPTRIIEAQEEIKKIVPDLLIVAAYGQYLPWTILQIPKYGAINIHPSLLPKYRGSSPIQFAILNGDKKTGVTIILMNEEMDMGDILAQEELLINQNYQSKELFDKLAEQGANLLIKIIPQWVEGKIKPKKQKKRAIYSKVLNRYDGKIDWKNSAIRIERQVRAFNPWPGAYTYFIPPGIKKEKLLKILEGGIQKQTKNGPFGPPGKTYVGTNGTIAVQTGQDFFLIKKFQIEGGQPIKTEEYLKNKLELIGLILK